MSDGLRTALIEGIQLIVATGVFVWFLWWTPRFAKRRKRRHFDGQSTEHPPSSPADSR